jgi:hypothetical protein
MGAELDENKYPKGLKVSDAQLAAVNSPATRSTATGTTRLHQVKKYPPKSKLTVLSMDRP